MSQPWLLSASVCQFLARCQSPTGGFGGGPGQHAHLAPTYAAVNALCILGTEEAYRVINRFHVCFVLSPVYLQMLRGSYCHSNTFCFPLPHQREAPGLPVLCEAARWLLCDACGRGGGCQVSSVTVFPTCPEASSQLPCISLFSMLLHWRIFQEWPFTVPNRQISARKVLCSLLVKRRRSYRLSV